MDCSQITWDDKCQTYCRSITQNTVIHHLDAIKGFKEKELAKINKTPKSKNKKEKLKEKARGFIYLLIGDVLYHQRCPAVFCMQYALSVKFKLLLVSVTGTALMSSV